MTAPRKTPASRKRVPTSAPKPQDHKPKQSAREAEAGDGYLTHVQCGIELHIPLGGEIPLKSYMAFKDGDEIEGTRLLLGDEQWEKFLAADPTMLDFAAIGTKMQEASGNR